MDGVETRQARRGDRDAVVDFAADTWPELGGDYIPRVFDEWVETDGPDQRTFVACVDDRPVGVCQGVVLSGHEAWGQGMRVAPEVRGEGVSEALTEALFAWAADRATVCRTMVFARAWPRPASFQANTIVRQTVARSAAHAKRAPVSASLTPSPRTSGATRIPWPHASWPDRTTP